MIEHVRSAGIYVSDQDPRKAFWTETLGFELVHDTPFGEGSPRSRTCSSGATTCAGRTRSRRRGVAFVDEPREEFLGWWASFRDHDGNTHGLGQ
jgi:catechol 2,3-dioxygenase-like lactoylglutathione lyase family enzyme